MLGCDVLVVGGGIVGLATAHQLKKKYNGVSVIVLEKEMEIGTHQSGRNSGVLHSGLYYKPGSQKAINCRKGKEALEAFCQEHHIPYERCGKIVVATTRSEETRLDALHERGKANGVQCEMIGKKRMLELEPHVNGLRALHVPETGIVDYKAVCRQLRYLIDHAGGCSVMTGYEVHQIIDLGKQGIFTNTLQKGRKEQFHSRYLINCAGLYADRVAKMCEVYSDTEKPAKIKLDAQIIPFRGDYFVLKPRAVGLCRNLIYPVPDPAFPFLGVHFTRMIGGGVECGPSAVLAFAREGYTLTTINLFDLWESLIFPGMRKLLRRYWQMGWKELLQSLSKSWYTQNLQKLIPAIRRGDLLPRKAGVRAQAVLRDGSLVDDFLIQRQGNAIHVINAPSPAATACLTIGEQVVGML